jgi:hypothetical protein
MTDKSISTGLKHYLGLLYKRALFDLQFVHNLFWLKLKWNTRSKLFLLYHLSFSMLWWSSRTLKYFIPVEIDLSVVPVRLGIWLFHLSRRTTVIQDLLVRRQFSLVPDNRTNVNVEACKVMASSIINVQIYFHWYRILGLLHKRALFDLQFVHNLFWLKLKWNARSKLFYCIIYRWTGMFGNLCYILLNHSWLGTC